MQRVSPRVSLIGLALAGGLIAAMLVAFMLTIGGQGAPKAYAIVTPQATPTCGLPTIGPKPGTPTFAAPNPCVPKGIVTPKASGGISGVYDIQVGGAVGGNTSIYNCITRIDQYAGDTVKSASECYLQVPPTASKGSTDFTAPPPPPDFTMQGPQKGYGFIAGNTLTMYTCFGQTGPLDVGALGPPNVIAQYVIPNFHAQFGGAPFEAQAGTSAPGAQGAAGTGVFLYKNQGSAQCNGLAFGVPPKGAAQPALTGPGTFIQVTKADSTDAQCAPCPLAPWRVVGNVLHGFPNWDMDKCTDSDELWAVKPGGVKCGIDPWNPSPPHAAAVADIAGVYNITAIVVPADACWNQTWALQGGAFQFDCTGKADGTLLPGYYFSCRAYIRASLAGPPVEAKLSCNTDFYGNGLLPNGYTVSANTAPGFGGSCAGIYRFYCGDGVAGAVPPGCNPDQSGGGVTTPTPLPCNQAIPNLATPAAGHCPAVNQGPSFFYNILISCQPERYQYAAVNNLTDLPQKKQTRLIGSITDNTLSLEGCFNSSSPHQSSLSTVYIQSKTDIQTGRGIVNIWSAGLGADTTNCKVPMVPPGVPQLRAELDNVRLACNAAVAGCPDTATQDGDGDGCNDAHELTDTIASAIDTNIGGGMRDPQNPWDFFDPFKGDNARKHNALDILIVQQHFGDNEWIKDPADQTAPPVLNDGIINPAIPAYSPAYDRSGLAGSNNWNLSAGDGYIKAVDMLIAQKSYGQNCTQTIPTAGS